MSTIVELSNIPIMCITAVDGIKGAQGAIDAVEAKLNKNLKGRKCYGVINFENGEMKYRACIVIQQGDDPTALGLESGEIPSGKYVRERIKDFDYRTDVPKIGQTFQKLAGENEVDESRPGLEFYKSHDEILVHVPIK